MIERTKDYELVNGAMKEFASLRDPSDCYMVSIFFEWVGQVGGAVLVTDKRTVNEQRHVATTTRVIWGRLGDDGSIMMGLEVKGPVTIPEENSEDGSNEAPSELVESEENSEENGPHEVLSQPRISLLIEPFTARPGLQAHFRLVPMRKQVDYSEGEGENKRRIIGTEVGLFQFTLSPLPLIPWTDNAKEDILEITKRFRKAEIK